MPRRASLWSSLFPSSPAPPTRSIFLNRLTLPPDSTFPDNKIRTTKYRWYSFIPRGLWEQFRRAANLYFLFHAVISLTPISPVNPVTTVSPLVFVIGIAMLKELWEDIQRGRSDKETNNRKVSVIQPRGSSNLVLPLGNQSWVTRFTSLFKQGGDKDTGLELTRAKPQFVPRNGLAGALTSNESSSTTAGALDWATSLESHALDRFVEGTVRRTWESLHVGEIVRVEDEEFFPADLLCLATSDPEGACYVETMNLDGETNLKLRHAVEVTRGMTVEELGGLSACVECEQPNVSIYTFVGNMSMGQVGRGGEGARELGHEVGGGGEKREFTVDLSPSNILLRGSKLRNTKYVYGITIFTGFDTKIMMNATDPPSKRSVIEKRLDYIVFFQICLLFLMAIGSAIAFSAVIRNNMPEQWYLRPDNTKGKTSIASAQFNWKSPVVAGILQFFTALVLYGYFVPISLYVSIEIVKLIQSRFINADRGMFYEEKNIPPRCRTSNLNEELGMVKTILSDKTGTLTRNQMEFFKCSIAGVSYGTGQTEVQRAATLRNGQRPNMELEAEDVVYVPEKPLEKGFNMRDDRLDSMNWIDAPDAPTIKRFLEVLAVCHTVVVDGEESPDRIKYLAESPDESAFVVAAKRFGMFFYRRKANEIWVREYGHGGAAVADRKYDLFSTLEFTSARKRMSVVVRDPEGRLLLLCKGADNVLLQRLGGDAEAQKHREVTEQHMTEYAEAGLRTLAIAWKPLDENDFREWQRKWADAKKDVTSAQSQAQKLEALAEALETGLLLLGSTAIEDKLQLGVPQTIQNLARAGIRLWVLTGDKLETAINIGFACSLLRHNMVQHLIHLEDDHQNPVQTVSAQITRGIQEAQHLFSVSNPSHSHAVIIDGKSLTSVFANETVKKDFLSLALICESVICCRVSPIQKAQITELVRIEGKQICLSVGDGANDVGMIQKANVGVGISGEEGTQAVMASDFSIGQFRFLERLLLVHGGWSYRRIAFMINFFFYKNFVYGFTVFYYNLFAQLSGSSVYYDWYLSLYNVIFSAFPVCVAACIDQDVKAIYRIRFPQLYRQGQENLGFTFSRFVLWISNGIYQSAAIFGVVMLSYLLASDRADGKVSDYLVVGTAMFTAVVLVVNLCFLTCIQYWTWIHHLAVWGEILLWIIFVLGVSVLPAAWVGKAKNIIFVTASCPSFYLIVLLAVVTALLPDFVVRAAKRNVHPDDHHLVQEIEMKERERQKRRGSRGVSEAQQNHAADRTV